MSAGGDADNRTGDGKIKAADGRDVGWVRQVFVYTVILNQRQGWPVRWPGRLFRQSSVWNQGFKRQRSPLPTSLGRILPAWRQLLRARALSDRLRRLAALTRLSTSRFFAAKQSRLAVRNAHKLRRTCEGRSGARDVAWTSAFMNQPSLSKSRRGSSQVSRSLCAFAHSKPRLFGCKESARRQAGQGS